MTHAQVEELRRKLASETSFADIWDYFLTNFAEQPKFLDRGTSIPPEPFIHCVGECYKRMHPEMNQVVLRNFIAVGVPEFNLTHGAFQMDDHWCGFFYCADLDMGLVCFANAKTGKSTMGRFHTDPKAMQGLSTTPSGVQ